MRFLVDAQLPPALARHLRELGHDAEHVCDLGLQTATDAEIYNRAVAGSAIVITKDEDFVVRRALDSAGPTIVWIRVGNTTKRELLARLSGAWPVIVEALERGEPVIEVV